MLFREDLFDSLIPFFARPKYGLSFKISSYGVFRIPLGRNRDSYPAIFLRERRSLRQGVSFLWRFFHRPQQVQGYSKLNQIRNRTRLVFKAGITTQMNRILE